MADTPRRHPTRGLVWPVLLLLLVVLIAAYFFLRAQPVDPALPLPSAERETYDTYKSGESFVTWFGEAHDDQGWYRSEFDNVDHFMQVGWAEDHIAFDHQGLDLLISDRPSETNRHTSGEYQRRGRYGFGRYEVIMRAPVGSGLVTSFFTHTGPYFGDPHDEIDFEILGKDTRRIYMTWFTDGQKGEAVWRKLGFDAAEGFHHYAFEWTPDSIRWFIDGEQVFERSKNSLAVPQTPGRIIANLWTGSPEQYGWHGAPNFSVPARAQYLCMSFRRLGDATTATCLDAWSKRDASNDGVLVSVPDEK